jgi:gluconokinase
MASNPTPPIIIMGVQGSGKSTIGALLAKRLDVPFVDGDDLHSDHNKQLMAAGHALTDTERMPWLRSVGERLAAGGGVVMACSALKRSYRDLLRRYAPTMITVYARGDMALIHSRITARHHEYMPASLLQSQFDALEEREADEAGIDVDVAQSPETIVDAILAFLTESVAVNAH